MKLSRHTILVIAGFWILNLGLLGLFVQATSYQEKVVFANKKSARLFTLNKIKSSF